MPTAKNTSMINTIRLFMNGELAKIEPVCGSRSGAPVGNVSNPMAMRLAANAQSANRSPRASAADMSPLFRWTASPRYSPSRGSTTRSVTKSADYD